MSMEFVMGNSLETLPKTIDFNFEELKGQLAESLALYTGLVVTEDGIKGAKEDRAKLNKLREALENKRKEVKRECMAPYTDFEAKVKELVGLIDQPIAAIDAQLKEYEEKRRADKRAAILEIYEETVGELRALLPFEKLWQDTWYNTSVTMKKVREAIVAAEDKAASDLEVLATVESEFAEAVKIKYLEHLDLNEALMERSASRSGPSACGNTRPSGPPRPPTWQRNSARQRRRGAQSRPRTPLPMRPRPGPGNPAAVRLLRRPSTCCALSAR